MFFSGSMEHQADILTGSDFAPQGFENKVQRRTLLRLAPFSVFVVGSSGTSEMCAKVCGITGEYSRRTE